MLNLIHYLENHPELPKEMQNLRIIHIRSKLNYGRTLLYPECDTAQAFSKLLNVKSFNEAQIAAITALGYIIQRH